MTPRKNAKKKNIAKKSKPFQKKAVPKKKGAAALRNGKPGQQSLLARGIASGWRPVCTSGHGYLGNCMDKTAAFNIAEAHRDATGDDVNLERC